MSTPIDINPNSSSQPKIKHLNERRLKDRKSRRRKQKLLSSIRFKKARLLTYID